MLEAKSMKRFLWVGFALLGCSGATVDVGPGGAGAGGQGGTGGGGAGAGQGASGAAGAVVTDWSDASTPSCVAASNLPLVGTWRGSVQGSSSDWSQMTLVITGASQTGGLCGTLQIVPGTPPAPATDPNLGYPPGAEPYTNPVTLFPMSGFSYSLLAGSTDGTRLEFGVSPNDPFRGWCAIQPPIADTENPGHFACAPNDNTMYMNGVWTLTPPSGPPFTIDGQKLALCGGGDLAQVMPCTCSAASCTALPTGNATFGIMSFDLVLSGDTLTGSNSVIPTLPTVFTRAP
jgi:hypothetical protein